MEFLFLVFQTSFDCSLHPSALHHRQSSLEQLRKFKLNNVSFLSNTSFIIHALTRDVIFNIR